MIARHPVTGRGCVFVNPLLTSDIIDMPPEDSAAALAALYDRFEDPAYRWEHVWALGDTLIWDNRGGVMHTGRLDYPLDQARRFIRTTVRGGPILPFSEPGD